MSTMLQILMIIITKLGIPPRNLIFWEGVIFTSWVPGEGMGSSLEYWVYLKMFNVGSIKAKCAFILKVFLHPSLKCIVHVPMRIKWGYQIKVSSCTENQFIVFSVMYFSKCVWLILELEFPLPMCVCFLRLRLPWDFTFLFLANTVSFLQTRALRYSVLTNHCTMGT